jgi:hypothetical protein
MKKFLTRLATFVFVLCLAVLPSQAQVPTLLAHGTLTQTRAGSNVDLSGLTYTLENGVPANMLGGLGSALAYAGGNVFLALPDRGPNATPYNSNVDDTVSYINRFQTIMMDLKPNRSYSGPPSPTNLPFNLTPTMRSTTLLWSLTPLVYGTGTGLGVGSGVPPINNFLQHFFTGRSDNFDPSHNSGDANDARLDSEGMRVSNNGLTVFISDEYGPYVYQFSRFTGLRLRSYKLPDSFYVASPSSMGDTEKAENTSGRVANKGMEGLAITPDGRTLVGIMQNALTQDSTPLDGSSGNSNLLRIVTIDIRTGTIHQYGYLLTDGSGVSEMCAINDHEFLVDERDGKGREGGDGGTSNKAKIKELFKIDLRGAVDISNEFGQAAANNAVSKTLFLDIVSVLKNNGFDPTYDIPSKVEGVAFGPDIRQGTKTYHTLWIANDNDFLPETADTPPVENPSEYFVFGISNADLAGSVYVPQFR